MDDRYGRLVGCVQRRSPRPAVDLCNSDFVPKGLRGNRGATLAAMLFGRELGLPPLRPSDLFSVDGRVGLYAQAMRLVLSRGHGTGSF